MFVVLGVSDANYESPTVVIQWNIASAVQRYVLRSRSLEMVVIARGRLPSSYPAIN